MMRPALIALCLTGTPAMAQTPVYGPCAEGLNDRAATAAAYQAAGWTLATPAERIRAKPIIGENWGNVLTGASRIETMDRFWEVSSRWRRDGHFATLDATILVSGQTVLSLTPSLANNGRFTCIFAGPDFAEVEFPDGTEPFQRRADPDTVGAILLDTLELDPGAGKVPARVTFIRHELGPALNIQTPGAEMILVEPRG